MNITIVLNSVLPAINYGGTQRVVWYLGKELSKKGHTVTFLASRGSQCPFARIVAIERSEPLSEQIPPDTDVCHFNDGVPEGNIKCPYIVTWHGNTLKGKLDRNSVFVSRNHASRYGSDSFVHNGLDWDDYGKVDFVSKRSYFHFLGNAAWRVKNLKGAIKIVEAMRGECLEVLGGNRFNFKMGMRFTFNPRIKFEGMVGGERKNSLLVASKGLIFPVVWNEPFGLAITESLYMGAPVFATPYGSLPELVNGDVGFLTDNRKRMVEHILNEYSYSAKRCHEYASDLFNSRLMAERYLGKYERVLRGEFLNETSPESTGEEGILPWYNK